MKEPTLKFADDQDKCWWVWPEGPKQWVVCFTATYAKELNRKKQQLTWVIESIGPDEKDRIRREIKRRAGAKRIVHLYIHRVIEPLTDADMVFIDDCNRRLKAERKELAKAG